MKWYMSVMFILISLNAFADSQQFNRRQVRQNCITPENYYGSCVGLSFCPQVANVYEVSNRRVAQQYIFALQRSCGTRSVNGDPLVCCTRPLNNVATQRPNPFFPTEQPFANPSTQSNRNPFLPNQRPSTTTRTTPLPSTSAPLIQQRGPSCRGPDAKPGECFDIKSCIVLLNELQAKQTDPTLAKFLQASNKICGGTGSIVCCPTGGTASSTEAPLITPANSDEVPRRLPSVAEGCGNTLNSYKKIVGGEVSKKGAWPWIALLGYDDASSSPFKCGGTLITARHVITAAHCIRSDLAFVRLGEHDLTTDSEARHIDIPISRYEAHTGYNRRNGRSDIAILYLQTNVKFGPTIAPICLPTSTELRRKSYVEYMPFVAGWGKTMEGGASASVLQELQIPIYPNDVCISSYEKQKRLLSADQFDAAVICAGVLSGGKDTCNGDSGGPLMIPEQNHFFLIGVVSYGVGCARPEIPGVYTSVQYFMDWILEKVQNTT